MTAQRWMWIVWPAFLVAAALEMVVFALIDPSDLQWFGSRLELSRLAVYTLSFFVFWFGAILSSTLTTVLSKSSFEVNQCPVPPDQRPPDCARVELIDG